MIYDKYDILSDMIINDPGVDLFYNAGDNVEASEKLRVLSLFSGCGGMDIGFEGGFICHKKSVGRHEEWINKKINDNWVLLKETKFQTIFANDILEEAQRAWLSYMKRRNVDPNIYHLESIVNLVKLHQSGMKIFPDNVDVVTGGFPCQDFSVAGKRKGFDSKMSHNGKKYDSNIASEETRGKLYYWMKQVIEIVKPKIFIAENVKGLVSLGDVKDTIQNDFAAADDGGYIVLSPRVLNSANYGVPEMRERVFFIGLRRSALTKEAIEALEKHEVDAEWDLYPTPTHNYNIKEDDLPRPVTCQDVFSYLQEPFESKDPSQQNYSKAKFMGKHCQGQTEINLYGVAPTIRSEHHGNIEYRRLSQENGGKYSEELSNGYKERRLTPRECALIQTFPPDYPFVQQKDGCKNKFHISPSGAYKVIGNAVPPVLGYHIANRIQTLWTKIFK